MSALEDQFLKLWKAKFGFIPLEREYSDIEAWETDFFERQKEKPRSRRYRLDFAHPETRTGIEIQGAVYSGGRHVRGSGYERDCRKYNLAYTSGWTIFLLTSAMAKDSNWHTMISSHILSQSPHISAPSSERPPK